MSTTTSPVTQTALVEVNRESRNGVQPPLEDDAGSIKSKAPVRITAEKLPIISCEEESRFLPILDTIILRSHLLLFAGSLPPFTLAYGFRLIVKIL